MNRNSFFVLVVLCCIWLLSCGGDKAPDVSYVEIDSQLKRFDQALAKLDTNNLEVSLVALQKAYPDFYPLYFQRILPLRNESPAIFNASIKGFLRDSSIQALYKAVDDTYGDFSKEKNRLDEALQYMKHYFPSRPTPDVYTFISEYSLQKFIAEEQGREVLGVGLDLFLGRDFPYQKLDPKNPAFSKYLTRRFDKEHLVKKVIEQIVDGELGPTKGDRLLDQMIHNGKRLYILEQLLPNEADSIIMEYTAKQMDWARKNEVEMYAFFFENDLFYNTNRMEINKYISVSPSSPGMPPAAPGRTANYLGWQIIKAYMQRHPDLAMPDLIAEQDAQHILNASRYKPSKG